MKSVNMSQLAFTAEIFSAYSWARHIENDVVKNVSAQVHIESSINSYQLKWEFKMRKEGGNWSTLVEHGFLKDAKELRSSEGRDICDYLDKQWWDFREKVNARLMVKAAAN